MQNYNIEEQENALKEMRKENITTLLILLTGCAITIVIYCALGGN
jgi:hypothetical protein